jgi:hypothetical protein
LAHRSLERVSGSLRDLVPLTGDASTRRFFRATFADDSSLVVMVYPAGDRDNGASFVDVQQYLKSRGLPVPKIVEHHPEHGTIIVEDLGDLMLEPAIDGMTEEEQLRRYTEAVDIILRMQVTSTKADTQCVAFDLAFDVPKLMWEMEFFLTHFVRGFAGLSLSETAALQLRQFLSAVCIELAEQPRFFTHRDYHSRNLMVCDRGLVMVDFQDARMGPCQYDLASLLKDSYVDVPEAITEQLVEYFHNSQPGSGLRSLEEFRRMFDLTSLQRNIKALGTFGYQTAVRGSDRFRSSIPRTGKHIAANPAVCSEFRSFRSVIEDFIIGPAGASPSARSTRS